jgi:hypothetical protein
LLALASPLADRGGVPSESFSQMLVSLGARKRAFANPGNLCAYHDCSHQCHASASASARVSVSIGYTRVSASGSAPGPATLWSTGWSAGKCWPVVIRHSSSIAPSRTLPVSHTRGARSIIFARCGMRAIQRGRNSGAQRQLTNRRGRGSPGSRGSSGRCSGCRGPADGHPEAARRAWMRPSPRIPNPRSQNPRSQIPDLHW